EKLKGLKSELKGLKPNTQAFVQQQNQIRRTEADMAQLSNEMRAYRKQLLYQDSALQKTNAKYKQQASVINSSIARYKAESNAINQQNDKIIYNEKIINRIRVVISKNSAEYAEKRAKLRAIKAETASYNAQLTQTTQKMKAMAVQQRASNSAMGRAMVGMQKNKAGLIDMRNSFMGLTAAAVGMAYPVTRALGGAVR